MASLASHPGSEGWVPIAAAGFSQIGESCAGSRGKPLPTMEVAGKLHRRGHVDMAPMKLAVWRVRASNACQERQKIFELAIPATVTWSKVPRKGCYFLAFFCFSYYSTGEGFGKVPASNSLGSKVKLSYDQFGNFVVQKLLETGTTENHRAMLQQVKGNVPWKPALACCWFTNSQFAPLKLWRFSSFPCVQSFSAIPVLLWPWSCHFFRFGIACKF